MTVRRFRLHVTVEIDSDDEPNIAQLEDVARQLSDGLKESDAYPDIAYTIKGTHAVFFVGHGVDRVEQDDVIIQHTFAVPVENLGGQNHGHDEWLIWMVNAASIDIGRVEPVAERTERFGGNDSYPAWLVGFTTDGAVAYVTVQGTERLLRFVCVLYDLHADQYPGDPTPVEEANKLEESIGAAKDAAAHLPRLTVGDLRNAIAGQPDNKLVTIYDGSGYKHAEVISDVLMPGETEEPTVILGMTIDFDTRDV